MQEIQRHSKRIFVKIQNLNDKINPNGSQVRPNQDEGDAQRSACKIISVGFRSCIIPEQALM